MIRLMQIGIIIFACTSMAVAQSDVYRKYEFFAGYSYKLISHGIGDNRIVDDPEEFRGFNTSITRNVSRYVGVKFDFSGHFNNRTIPFGPSGTGIDFDSHVYNFTGGVQVKDSSSETTFKPFLHALLGAAHVRNRVNIRNEVCVAIFPSPCPADFTERETGVAGIFGGGIDVRVSDRIDIRIVQFDYNPTRVFDTMQPNLRLGVGVVFH